MSCGQEKSVTPHRLPQRLVRRRESLFRQLWLLSGRVPHQDDIDVAISCPRAVEDAILIFSDSMDLCDNRILPHSSASHEFFKGAG